MLNQDISELPVLKVSIPSFLLKMYEILEQPKFAEIVSWNNDGSSFVVFNTHDLSSKVLANYFKHKNYPSFLRQLNMYNFKKTKNQNGQSEFRHKWFRRGLKSMLQYIRRRNQDESEVKVESRQNNYQLDQYKRDHETMKEQIQQLVTQSQEMHRTLEASLEQGASVRRINSNLQQVFLKVIQQFANLESSNTKKFDTISMLLARIVSSSSNLQNHLGEIFRITLTDDPRTSLQDRQPRFEQLNYQLMNRESQYRPPIQNPYPWFNSSQPSGIILQYVAVDFSQFYQMQSPYSQPGRPPQGQMLALPPIPYSYQQSPLLSQYPSQPSSVGNSPYRSPNPVAHSHSTDTRSHDKYSFNQIS